MTISQTHGETELDTKLTNKELQPVPAHKRKWTWYSYMALWMGMVHNIFNYEVAAGLIALGMNVWQALLTIFVADMILMIPLALNGYVGNKYGIPFPVFARLTFGVFGANIPALIRAFVAIGWFGVQSFLGSTALNALLVFTIPAWAHLSANFLGLPVNAWISLLLFWILQGIVATHGMDVIRRFENWAGPAILILLLGLVIWAISVVHGLGPIFNQPSKFHTTGSFLIVFGPAVISVIGSWATLGLNITDFTRFSRSTKDQVIGQTIGLPVTTFVFSLMSTFVTSATIVAFGQPIWDPVELLKHFQNPVILIIGAATLTAATISVNVASNLVSPIYDLINVAPRKFTFKTAAWLSMAIAFFMMPWKLMQNPNSLFLLLDIAGSFLGPTTGILIADFWIVRKGKINVPDLYQTKGAYSYYKGFHVPAIIALALSMALTFIGDAIPALSVLNQYAWLVGVISGFIFYLLLVKIGRARGPRVVDTVKERDEEVTTQGQA